MNYNWENKIALIAEDDPLNFKYVELLLSRRTGIQIIWAKDGKRAVEILKEIKTIDIVLLDLQLPELDGIQALKKIREDLPDLPVIIQTANSWNNEEEVCLEAGCTAFFQKPLNIDLLLLKMEQCMAVHDQTRQTA